MTAKHPLIPFPVIVRATDGDIEAVNQIVRHYSGFIASRSMRPMKDEYGNTHMVVEMCIRDSKSHPCRCQFCGGVRAVRCLYRLRS